MQSLCFCYIVWMSFPAHLWASWEIIWCKINVGLPLINMHNLMVSPKRLGKIFALACFCWADLIISFGTEMKQCFSENALEKVDPVNQQLFCYILLAQCQLYVGWGVDSAWPVNHHTSSMTQGWACSNLCKCTTSEFAIFIVKKVWWGGIWHSGIIF